MPLAPCGWRCSLRRLAVTGPFGNLVYLPETTSCKLGDTGKGPSVVGREVPKGQYRSGLLGGTLGCSHLVLSLLVGRIDVNVTAGLRAKLQ